MKKVLNLALEVDAVRQPTVPALSVPCASQHGVIPLGAHEITNGN